MSKAALRCDWASHDAAAYACNHWHYSKSVPVPPLVKVGAWECGDFIGCVIFSRGASSNLLKPYGLKQDEGCELTRVALSEHKVQVTRVIKIAVKMLKQQCPGLRLVVSFADPHQGHHGGIYQGGNWIYAGTTSAGREYWKHGRKLHSRQVSEKGWNVQQGQVRAQILAAA